MAHPYYRGRVPVTKAIARALERGDLAGSAIARAASAAWGRAVRVARPLAWPDGVRVVTVGGATLGGSGKTPLAIAIAEKLAQRGDAVALVGHAYRATPQCARVVAPDDRVEEVGDEAIVCARALAGSSNGRARVVVAPKRQAAVDFAIAGGARTLVVDGVLQTTPRRADRAILAVDAHAPWGSGSLFPAGDLRAPRATLLAACDDIVRIDDACIRSAGVRVGTDEMPWSALAGMRLGLATAVARPERVLRFVRARGVEPAVVVHGADHAPLRLPHTFRANVDLWLATEKCALHMLHQGGEDARAIAVIPYAIDLQSIAAIALP
jgi:tetraacyldisaccharide 4'-kinase